MLFVINCVWFVLILIVLFILFLVWYWLDRQANSFYQSLASQGKAVPAFTTHLLYVSTDNAVTVRLFNLIPLEQDDGLALTVLLKAHQEGKLKILGISSVFGNIDGDTTYQVTKKQIELSRLNIPVTKGAVKAGQTDSPAVTEITKVLETTKEKVTLIALGPVTDYASVFKAHPELISKVDLFYFVRSGPYFHPQAWYLSSFNAQKDLEAAKYLFSLPIQKVAIDRVITHMTLTNADIVSIKTNLHPMVQFISQDLTGWNLVNKVLPNPGYLSRKGNMAPWDLVWSMYLVRPELFTTYQEKWGYYLKINNTKELMSVMVEEIKSYK